MTAQALKCSASQGTEGVIRAMRVTLANEVTEIEIPSSDVLGGLYRAIGCSLVDRVQLASRPSLDMWVDDEGLINDESSVNLLATLIAHAFQLSEIHGDPSIDPGWLQPYAGVAVFLSADDDGNSISVSSNWDRVWIAARTLAGDKSRGLPGLLAMAARL